MPANGSHKLCQHHFEPQFLSKPETQNYIPTQTELHQHNITPAFSLSAMYFIYIVAVISNG
jgi:hypothetical protein